MWHPSPSQPQRSAQKLPQIILRLCIQDIFPMQNLWAVGGGGLKQITIQDPAINLIFRQGGIESIANDYSLRATPSYVAFGEKQRTMGVAAKSGQMTNVPKTFFGFKRLLGRKFDDPQVQDELTRSISGLLFFFINNRRNKHIHRKEQISIVNFSILNNNGRLIY